MEKNIKFNVIACVNRVGAIGKDNKLIYQGLHQDLKRFKAMTVGNVIIMGRKTLESLPKGEGLKDRINIVMSSNDTFSKRNCVVVNSYNSCMNVCKNLFSDRQLFIIGGYSIYKEFMEKDEVENLYLTVVDDTTSGDVYFPIELLNNFERVSESEEIEENGIKYKFVNYKRKDK